MQFNEQIKQLRVDHDLTQEAAAEKLHVTRQTISNWENGNNYPDLETLIAISKLYDISVDELLDGDKQLAHDIRRSFSLFHALVLAGVYITYLGITLLYFWFTYQQTPVRSTILLALTTVLGGFGLYAIDYIGHEFNGLKLQVSHFQANFQFSTSGSIARNIIIYYLIMTFIMVAAFFIPDIQVIKICADIIVYIISGFVLGEGLLLVFASILVIKMVHHFNNEVRLSQSAKEAADL